MNSTRSRWPRQTKQCERLANYPVLDEDDFGQREWNAQCETLGERGTARANRLLPPRWDFHPRSTAQ